MADTYDYSELFDERGRLKEDAATIWRRIQARIENTERLLREQESQFEFISPSTIGSTELNTGKYLWMRQGSQGDWDAFPRGDVLVDYSKKNALLCHKCPCDTACYWLFESICSVTTENGVEVVEWSTPSLVSVECMSKPDIVNTWFWYQDNAMRIYKEFDASKNPHYKGENSGCDPDNNVCSQMVPPDCSPPTGDCCRSQDIGEFLIKQEDRGWEVSPSETHHNHETRVDHDPDGDIRIKYGTKTYTPKDLKVMCPIEGDEGRHYFDCGRIYGSATAPDCEWWTWKLEFPEMQARLTIVMQAPDGDISTGEKCYQRALTITQQPKIDDQSRKITNIKYAPEEIKIAPGWTAYLVVSALWSFPKQRNYSSCNYDPNVRCNGDDVYLGAVMGETIIGHKWLSLSINDIRIPQIAKSVVCIEYNYYMWEAHCEKNPCMPECSRISDPAENGYITSPQYPPFPYNGSDSDWMQSHSTSDEDWSKISGWLHQNDNDPSGVWRAVDSDRDIDAVFVRLMCKSDFFTEEVFNIDKGNVGQDYAYKAADHDLPFENGSCQYDRDPEDCVTVKSVSDVICPPLPELACCKQGNSRRELDSWVNRYTLPKHCFDHLMEDGESKEKLACPGQYWRIKDIGGPGENVEEMDWDPSWGTGRCYEVSASETSCGTTYEGGYVNKKGQLVGLPQCFENAYCYNGYMHLQLRCPNEDWPACSEYY